MKLAHKFAGVFACGAFILVSLTTYFASMNPITLVESALNPQTMDEVVDTSLERPLKVLTLAFPSAVAAGILGYLLGGVLGKPKRPVKSSASKAVAVEIAARSPSPLWRATLSRVRQ